MKVLEILEADGLIVAKIRRWSWLRRRVETWLCDNKVYECPDSFGLFHPGAMRHCRWYSEDQRKAGCWLACALDEAVRRRDVVLKLQDKLEKHLDKVIGLDEQRRKLKGRK